MYSHRTATSYFTEYTRMHLEDINTHSPSQRPRKQAVNLCLQRGQQADFFTYILLNRLQWTTIKDWQQCKVKVIEVDSVQFTV